MVTQLTKRTTSTRKKSKKKVAKRRPIKKKAVKHPPAKKPPEHHPDNPETQVLVWATYARLRSVRRTAQELHVKDWVVREVLKNDRDELLAIMDNYMEAMISHWESAAVHGHHLMNDMLEIVGSMLTEIKTAALEKRITVIRDQDGYPMPVLDAAQFVVVCKLFDQIARMTDRAQTIFSAYRAGKAIPSPVGNGYESRRFDEMSDVDLAAMLRDVNLTLPPGLAQKIKMIENKADQP